MSSESWRLGEAKLRLDAMLRVMAKPCCASWRSRAARHGEAVLRVMAKPCCASWRSRAARHGEAVLRTDDIRGMGTGFPIRSTTRQ
jgi:hypothetical protein